MKRGELKRKTPLRSTSTLKAKVPMARGTVSFSTKPKTPRKKRAAHNAGPDYLSMCRGQPCYLRIPGICTNDRETVVPCHSNSLARGKGMGLKAQHIFTVPGCYTCHMEIDQGKGLSKEERRQIWEHAYSMWEIKRRELYGSRIDVWPPNGVAPDTGQEEPEG